MKPILLLLTVLAFFDLPCFSQTKMTRIKYIKNDFSINEFDHKSWKKADEIAIEKYWSGDDAPEGRRAKAKLLWSENALYVRFEALQTEPLVVSEKPDLKTKTHGLWERDVCEIFLAPDRSVPQKYFEFEIAPTGEWIDLKIYKTFDGRATDWDYASGMQSAASIEKDKVWMAIKIDWKAFDATPKGGDVWLGNLFRCVGRGSERGYLAWRPTKTVQPSFHVPEAFGEFEFVK